MEEAWQAVDACFGRFCLAAGIEALQAMTAADVEDLCGRRHARSPERRGHRWGRTRGKIGYQGGKVEHFMVQKINDAAVTDAITSNQTGALVKEFRTRFPAETTSLVVLDRVALMTPENIHLNSFMYEPIMDMSDAHLRKLYEDAKALA